MFDSIYSSSVTPSQFLIMAGASLAAIPIIIVLAVLVTYIFMLTTSLGNIAYFLRKKSVLGEPLDTATILGVVFSFIFCLDVVGAIILYRRSEVIPEQASPETPADQN